MIYYFSGTGNSEWAARELASKTNDSAASLVDLVPPSSADNQTIGIVFPIYAWGVPEPVLDFLKKLRGQPAYAYGVCTCGDEAGKAMEKLESIFPLNAAWSVAMPTNYVMGADVESDQSIRSKMKRAEELLDKIAMDIAQKKVIHEVNQGSIAWVKSTLFNLSFNRFARSTRGFYADDNCNSCGLCAQICPAHSITMHHGKPRWGEKCYRCTACINRCPTKAIQYGKGTLKRGRYQFKQPSAE